MLHRRIPTYQQAAATAIHNAMNRQRVYGGDQLVAGANFNDPRLAELKRAYETEAALRGVKVHVAPDGFGIYLSAERELIAHRAKED